MTRTILTVHDQFCGAGGSSQGIRRLSRRLSGGLEVTLAMDSWELALETHAANFPQTDHDCVDIQTVDPRRYPAADILITSPECTNHSNCKGVSRKFQDTNTLFGDAEKDDKAELSRATMWEVPRFAEVHKYKAIITENVVEAAKWIHFQSWLSAMHKLGYDHKVVSFNSMFAHPTPQSRDRIYVVFWRKGQKAPDLDFRPKAHCPHCGKDVDAVQTWKNGRRIGKYKAQYIYTCPDCYKEVTPYYYAAFNCIDWSIPGTRIGDLKKPLCSTTLRRIKYGIEKYGHEPMVIINNYSTGIGCRIRTLHDPIQTQVTNERKCIVIPPAIFTYGYTPGTSRPATAPSATITPVDHTQLVYVPFIVENFGQSNAKSIYSPLGTQPTKPHYALASPKNIRAFLDYYNTGVPHPLTDATTNVEDWFYRMLKAPEVKRAMDFDEDYIIKGNAEQQIKQLGNGVNPAVEEMICSRIVATL
jgi:DNA (cytosine-5)-methyltransferase 1